MHNVICFQKKICVPTGRVGLCFLWFFVQELPKAQPAVVLVLKRLRRRGNSLKSRPTDWEKPGIEPATPDLQNIGLSPTPRRLLKKKKKKICVPTLPKILRPITRNTLTFSFGLAINTYDLC